jgi:carboxyl-terminal processing protease
MKNSYSDFRNFNNTFVVTDDLLKQLDNYAVEIGLAVKPESDMMNRDEIKQLFKAYVARDLYSTNEFYEVLNQTDTDIMRAVEVIKGWNEFTAKVLY